MGSNEKKWEKRLKKELDTSPLGPSPLPVQDGSQAKQWLVRQIPRRAVEIVMESTNDNSRK